MEEDLPNVRALLWATDLGRLFDYSDLGMKRTHNCGQLRASDVGSEVSLVGWIDSIRDHGGILFIDLRDREGLTQIKADPHSDDAAFNQSVNGLKDESVIAVAGQVVARDGENVNPSLPTGEVEVDVSQVVVHNIAETPPFPIDDVKGDRVHEDLRLKYRYLDLRRDKMRKAIKLRHETTRSIRSYLDDEGFYDVETPTLFKSTPEGAREYLVPSRIQSGHFYALPQSPQQFKQMLMVSGIERYYQIARCYRDEDLRADRQMEFTQLDMEISFIDREGMYSLVEGLMKRIWKDTLGVEIETPFPRMSFKEAMDRFGVDKPDTRFGIEISDFSETFASSSFKVFSSTVKNGGVVKALKAPGLANITQGELKNLEEVAKSLGAKGLAFIKIENGEWKSPIVKFFSEDEKAALQDSLNLEEGDIVFFAASQWEQACSILGRIRLECAELLKKRGELEIPLDQYKFLWVIDFPLMTYEEDQGRYVASHHPFTAPVPEDCEFLESDPKKVRGQHYDLVLNGVELGGGSIRIHQTQLQKKIFEDVLDIPKDVVQSRFGYMLEAFKYGAPPHGGIAFGLDRLVMILAGVSSIREVIAFPKTQKGQCLMTESPSPVSDKQLKELHIECLSLEDESD